MDMKQWNQDAVRKKWSDCRQQAAGFWALYKKEITRTAAGMAAACVLTVGGAAMVQPNAYEITYRGELLGYTEEPTAVEEALNTLQEDVAEATGVETVSVDRQGITVAQTRVSKRKTEFLDAEDIEEQLMEREAYSCTAYSIVVDGQTVLTAASEEQANAILEAVKDSYKSDRSEILDVAYKESVEVVACNTAAGEIMSDTDSAITYILTGAEDPRIYIVKEGDTLWDIAHANDMSSAELIAANPGFDPNKLKIGQELNLIAMEPFMTVVITENVTTNEAIPFTTTYEKTNTLYKGQTSIKTAGQDGTKEVVSRVVSENGVVVSSEQISETVIAEPVMQVAYEGTKPVVYVAASGKVSGLSNPLASIQVSDSYGASRGSRRHLGVDLRAPLGTPIYAAADGVVTKVSSTGSYGKLVVISHGNGLTTKYAHCNSFNVSVGDAVVRGQQIATVGSTGNATGNILHYEVLVNGSNRNPVNYLN